MKKTHNGNGKPTKPAELESDEDVMTVKKTAPKTKAKSNGTTRKSDGVNGGAEKKFSAEAFVDVSAAGRRRWLVCRVEGQACRAGDR